VTRRAGQVSRCPTGIAEPLGELVTGVRAVRLATVARTRAAAPPANAGRVEISTPGQSRMREHTRATRRCGSPTTPPASARPTRAPIPSPGKTQQAIEDADLSPFATPVYGRGPPRRPHPPRGTGVWPARAHGPRVSRVVVLVAPPAGHRGGGFVRSPSTSAATGRSSKPSEVQAYRMLAHAADNAAACSSSSRAEGCAIGSSPARCRAG
jgi:hypothetical protein